MSAYNLGTASGKIEINGRGAAAGFKVAETAADAFMTVIQNKIDSVQQLGRRLTAVGGAGAAGIGLAIKTAASFQQQMSGVQAVTGSTGDEFEALREKALQLGADTTYSASEAAQAIEELAKAGIPVQDILEGAAAGAVSLAAAGGVGLEEAATIAANAMNQFGLGADKVQNVADILAGVANTSAADVSSIGTSLSQAGAVANLAGLSFRDTAIAIGEMADAGINGSDAGTSLKTMLNNLIPTTTKQIKKFKELGLLTFDLADANKSLAKITGGEAQTSIAGVQKELGKYVEGINGGTVGTVKNATAVQDLMMQYGGLKNSFFDAQGNIKKLGGLQGELAKALSGMTKQQKLSTLETLFGADAMRATAILSLEGAKGYKEFSKAVGETSAADVAKTRLDNLAGATEAMKGSFETAMITIGNIFLPVVTKIIQGITWLINAFNKLPNSIKMGIVILGAIASAGALVIGMILALLPLILGMIANFLLMRSLGVVVTGLKTLWTTLRAGQGVMVASRAAALATGNGFLGLGKKSLMGGKMMIAFSKILRIVGIAMKFALGPWGLLILVIIGALVLLYKKFAPFKALVDGLASAIKGGLVSAWNTFKDAMATAWVVIKQFGTFVKATLLPVLRSVGEMLMGKLMTGWKEIKSAIASQLMPAIEKLVAVFNGEVSPVLQKVGGFLSELGATISAKVLPILMKMGEVFVTVILPILIKVAGFLTGVVIGALVSLVKGAIQAISGIIGIFTGLINFFKGVFTGNWSQAWEGLKQIFFGFLDLIVGAVKVALQVGFLKVFGLAFKAVAGLARIGWAAISGLFRAAGTRILAVLKGAFSKMGSMVSSVMNFIRGLFSKGWNFIKSLVVKAGTGIVNAVRNAINFQMTIVRNGLTSIKNFFTTIWSAIKTAVSNAWNGIKTAVQNGIDGIMTLVKSIQGKITGALSSMGSSLYNAGVALIQQLVNGITKKIGDAVDAVKNGLSKIKGLLPGSPIKYGPLVGWNKGGAGKRLMQTLQDGITREGARTALAAGKTAYAIGESFNKNMHMMDPSVTGQLLMDRSNKVTKKAGGFVSAKPTPIRPKPKPSPKKEPPMRIVGELEMINGKAYITGIALRAVDAVNNDNGRRGRMNYSG